MKKLNAVKDMGIVYLKPGITPDEWIKSDEWVSVLYDEFLYRAQQIIYEHKNHTPVVTLVSIRYETVGDVEIPVITNDIVYLQNDDLQGRLIKMLRYAEKKERYEDCATIRDMLIELNKNLDK